MGRVPSRSSGAWRYFLQRRLAAGTPLVVVRRGRVNRASPPGSAARLWQGVSGKGAPSPAGSHAMPTVTFECRTEAEAASLRRAAAFVAEMHHLAQAAPDGQVLPLT